jgi:hydrogenase maturation factor
MKRNSRPRRGRDPKASLPLGKLPPALLEECLKATVLADNTVLEEPRIGADAALLAPPEGALIAVTSDPITFTSADVGFHLLAVNINDVVTTGAYPRWLSLNLLLPPGTAEQDVVELFDSVSRACVQFDVTLVGGHTEITDAVVRPVAVGTLLGVLKKDRRVDPSRSRPGDAVVLIGQLAVEGTAVLARERKAEVEEAFGKRFQRQAVALLEDPGICIRDPALLSATRYLVHALHDPTEGGVATALRELSSLTGHGLEVNLEEVEVLPETLQLCEFFGLDPYGLLASGSLLAVLPEEEALRLARALPEQLSVTCRVIGRLTRRKSCLWRRGVSDSFEAIPEFERDEILRVLERR